MSSRRNSKKNRNRRRAAARAASRERANDTQGNDVSDVTSVSSASSVGDDRVVDEAPPAGIAGTASDSGEFELRITLQSDLCAASGDGFSSGIDTDVCHDVRGVPYIPGRRLKGCLREAAELVCTKDEEGQVRKLFGRRGSSVPGSIVVDDATIRSLGGEPFVAREDATRQEMLDLFAYTRAQTALVPNEGYAKRNSLRYVRVVGHYDPLCSNPVDAEPLSFVADVHADVQYKDLLERSAKALRNIGFDRNRGFGAVRCAISPMGDGGEHGTPMPEVPSYKRRLCYRVLLKTPLMLPQTSGSEGLGYVPGTSVLGFFASRLKDDPDFDELFLKGRVTFSPLYPVDGARNRCRPAPPFVVKVKGGLGDGKCCTSPFFNSDDAKSGYRSPGAGAKPLKGGFVDANWHPVDERTEVVYHHSTRANEDGDQPTLYMQRCLSAGQELAGYIQTDSAELYEKLAGVLRSGDLSFGRSKTAQYARCVLAACEEGHMAGKVDVKKGRRYAFLLDSDAILAQGASYAALKEAILSALSEQQRRAFVESDVEEGSAHPSTSLSYRTITGFNAKWGQKRPHVRAIASGSAVVFKASSSASLPGEFTIGERSSEGYGRVLVVDLDTILSSEKKNHADGKCPIMPVRRVGGENGQHESQKLASRLQKTRELERLRVSAAEFAESKRALFCKMRLNQAFVGRIALMAEESSDRDDFQARIGSIKTKRKREDATKLFEEFEEHSQWPHIMAGTDLGWEEERECLVLVLTLGKYFAKEKLAKAENEGGDDA